MKLKRILAWIAILLIPISYIITIILSVLNHPYAEPLLGVAIITTFIGPTLVYLFTVFPKHIAKIGVDLTEHDDKNQQN